MTTTATRPTARHLVYRILLPLEKGRMTRPHLEDLLDEGFRKQSLSTEDRGFATYLTYGVVRHWFGLNEILSQFSKLPVEKLTPTVRVLLKMGLFQLYAMDSVPDFAAVSTTLNLAESFKQSPKTRGLINAILQNFIRKGKPVPEDARIYFPEWSISRLEEYYDADTVAQILTAQRAIPHLTLRVNTLKTTVENFIEHLNTNEIPLEQDANHPEILHLTRAAGDPTQLPGFEAGWFLVQDAASSQVGYFLNPQPGDTVLEIGAAPGTKTSHLAALMQNTGSITAIDIHENRLKKLTENCQRLGVAIASAKVVDATKWHKTATPYDKILIDAPCSGTGTLGKHPEILLTLKPSDFQSFAQTQLKLLQQVFPSLRPGGVLVYSTCSIDPEENQQVIQAFLATLGDSVRLDEEALLLPSTTHDGFYMARMIKAD